MEPQTLNKNADIDWVMVTLHPRNRQLSLVLGGCVFSRVTSDDAQIEATTAALGVARREPSK